MAKTKTCAFCGKELTTGLFKGTANILFLSYADTITCCSECEARYKSDVERIKERFETKLHNYKAATKKKLSETELVDLFKLYLKEEEEQKAKGLPTKLINYGFFCVDEEGRFYVKESKTGLGYSDVSAKNMLKSLDEVDDRDTYCFDKNDITRIEYRMVSKFGDGDLFHKAHSFEIRLNDEKQFTYKPCIIKSAAVGASIIPYLATKKAKETFKGTLESFKNMIGSELPIVEVKKFS